MRRLDLRDETDPYMQEQIPGLRQSCTERYSEQIYFAFSENFFEVWRVIEKGPSIDCAKYHKENFVD